ncbi:MAG: hypothetical protein KBF50_14605 [Steroidobacteraceae bacterium]|nr:hypothetical protein [Steroidobacteraceae bacterium]
MSNVFKTFLLPAALGAKAVAITNALGYPEKGMFTAKVAETDATDVDGNPTTPVIAYIASGIVDSASPLLADAATLWAAVQAGTPGTVTLADCQAVVEALDLTSAEPFGRRDVIREEIKLGATAVAWVQPVGAHDAYGLNAVVSYGGKSWRSLIAANVWAPGVSGWRPLWATTSAPPQWVQPTGAGDAYALGALVAFEGRVYRSKIAANVWSPTAYPAGWELV